MPSSPSGSWTRCCACSSSHMGGSGRPPSPPTLAPPRRSRGGARYTDTLLASEESGDRAAFALAQRDRDPELLEILRERLAAEVDLAAREEVVHVALELRRREPRHALRHPARPVLWIETVHHVPLALDERHACS